MNIETTVLSAVLFLSLTIVLQAAGVEVEKEVNNTILQPNTISMGTPVAAAIEAKDTDYFRVAYPGKVTDWIKVEVINRSTTLRPGITLYNSKKAQMTYHYQDTSGADLSFTYVASPNQSFYLQVYSRSGTTGKYHLKVTPQGAYDQFEPNDTAFDATKVSLGKSVTANIMYKSDSDYFQVVTAAGGKKKVRVTIENGSTSLRPGVTIYNRKKAQVTYAYEDTSGGDLEMSFDCTPGEKYYIQVYSRSSTTGKYRLTVEQ
jgi:hypothetical protein